MNKNKPVFLACLALGLMLWTGCTDPVTETTQDDSSDQEITGAERLAAYGIDSNLGDRTDSQGNALPQAYNPLGETHSWLQSRKEIVFSGFQFDSAAYGYTNGVIQDSASQNWPYNASYVSSIEYKVNNTDDTWSRWPHATVAADTDGNGIEEAVSICFTPDSTANPYLQAGANPGKISIGMVQKKGSSYERTVYTLPDNACTLYLNTYMNRFWSTDIVAADIDMDGKDELGVVVGTKFMILDDADAGFATLMQTVDYRGGDTGTYLYIARVAAGDITGDGVPEFVVSEGTDGSQAGKYHVYDSTYSEISVGSLTFQSNGIQFGDVVIGDIDRDNKNEVFFAGDSTGNYGTLFRVLGSAWDATSNALVFSRNYLGANRGDFWDDATCPGLAFLKQENQADIDWDDTNALVAYNVVLTPTSNSFTVLTDLGAISYSVILYGAVDTGDVTLDGNDDIVLMGADYDVSIFTRNASGYALNQITHILSQPWYGFIPNICLADLDGDSVVLELYDHNLVFSDPVPVAVLASPPYYEGYDNSTGSTSISYESGSSSSTSHSLSITAGIVIGISVEAPLLGDTAFGLESTTTLEASFSYTASQSVSVSSSTTYATPCGSDGLLFTCVPYDKYRYKVIKAVNADELTNDDDGDGTLEDNELIVISLPRRPQLIKKEVTEYNKLPGIPFAIDSTILTHTLGKPDTYPSYAEAIDMTKNKNSGMIHYNGVSVAPYENGPGNTVSVNWTIASATAYNAGISISHEDTSTVAGVVFGRSLGLGYDFEYSVETSSGTSIEGTIPDLPGSAPDTQTYTTGIFGASVSKTYTSAETGLENSAEFMFISYWTRM